MMSYIVIKFIVNLKDLITNISFYFVLTFRKPSFHVDNFILHKMNEFEKIPNKNCMKIKSMKPKRPNL